MKTRRATPNRIKFLALVGVLFVVLFFVTVPSYAATSITDTIPDFAKTGAVWDTDATTTDGSGSVVFETGEKVTSRTLLSNTQITFKNSAGAVLPNTGGRGTTIFLILGVSLILLSACSLWMRRRAAFARCPQGRGDIEEGEGKGSRRGIISSLLLFAVLLGVGTGITVFAATTDLSSMTAEEVETYVTHADLRIANTVEDNATDQYFTVTVSLAGDTNTDINGEYTISGGSSMDNPSTVTIENNSATITLKIKNNETITIEDLPVNTTYSAVESDNDGFNTSHKVEATEIDTVTLTVTPYLSVSGWTADQEKLHDAYTYQIPKGATINLDSFGLNDPDLTFLYWNSAAWSWNHNSDRNTSITMDSDVSVEEWYRATFGYYMVILDRGFYTDNQGKEVAEGTENSAYNYGFIQFGLANDATAALTAQSANTRTGYKFGGWYTQPNGEGEKITDVLDGEIDISNYTSASDYLTDFTNRRATLKTNLLDKAADSTDAQLQGLRTYQDLLKTGRGSTFQEGTYVATKTLYAYWVEAPLNDTVIHAVAQWRFGKDEDDKYINNTISFDTTHIQAYANTTVTLTEDQVQSLNGFELQQFECYQSGVTLTPPSGSSTTGVGSTFTQPRSDVTIWAYYQPISYTITYDTDGGTNPSDAQSTYTVLSGFTLPTPTKSGYRFVGWQDADGNMVDSVTYDNSSSALTSDNFVTTMSGRKTGNLSLKAVWKQQVTVNWLVVKDGSYSGTWGSKSYDKGTVITLDSALLDDLGTDVGYTLPDDYVVDHIYDYYQSSTLQPGDSYTVTGHSTDSSGNLREGLYFYIVNVDTATLLPEQQGIGDVRSKSATSFQKGTLTQYQAAKSAGTTINTISVDGTSTPVYQWTESDGNAYWYSQADIVYMNPDSSWMFNNCNSLTSIDLSGFNTKNVTDMSYMFDLCEGLTSLNISNFNTSKVTSMQGMFLNCRGLTSLDVSGFDTGNVTSMQMMFNNCSGLTSLDVSSFNTGNVTKMGGMFLGCSGLTSLSVSGLDTGNVTDMSRMFEGCEKLTSLDVSSFDTGNVKYMNQMFEYCGALTSLDVSNFDTSEVTSMQTMFKSCSGLSSIDVTNFNTSKVTNMRGMFSECSGLTSLDVSHFDTGEVTTMEGMFKNCSGLTSLDLSAFNTGSVTDMGNMFQYCSGLTSLNVSGFNTGNVTNMNFMFDNCSSLTSLNISDFDTSKVTSMMNMFSNCSALTNIYAGAQWSTTSVRNGLTMFTGSSNLPNFDSSYVDKTRAYYGGDGKGYLTEYTQSSGAKGSVTFDPNWDD